MELSEKSVLKLEPFESMSEKSESPETFMKDQDLVDGLNTELETISERQLDDLLVHRHIFRQFVDATQPYIGSQHGAVFSEWIARNYVAFAATTIRRIVDRRKDAHSLVRFLNQVKMTCTTFSRQRIRQQFIDSLSVFAERIAIQKADELFDYSVGRSGQQALTNKIIGEDISKVEQTAKSVTEIANSWITHDSKSPKVSKFSSSKKMNL